MFYAKLDADGKLERYPYTLTDLRRDNKQTSFERNITQETALAFNCVPVTQTAPPTDDYTKNYERSARNNAGTWEEQWIESDATSEQVTERTTSKANEARQQRTTKLTDSDWTQLVDSTADKAAWATYRSALRDLPAAEGFPHTMTWPTEPS